MQEEENKAGEQGIEESFEDLLRSYEPKGARDIHVGDRIEAKVVSIGRESVFVDTGTMIDGVIEKSELMDERGRLTCGMGDTLNLYVVAVSEGQVRLSKALSGPGGLKAIKDAYENEVPIEGKVLGKCKGGFEVSIMQRRAFCPASQMDFRYADNPEQYVGQTYRFMVTQLDQGGRNIVVSRRRLLEKELERERQDFLSQITEGQTLEGKVTKLANFGAFVEIFPGVEGMVHVSELSWSHVSHPEEILGVGQRVKVKIVGIEADETAGKRRISLSIKQATADPWEGLDQIYKVGQIVEGKVMRCTSFGAFVELKAGVEGLVHISEMSYTRRILKPEEVVSPGDVVKVVIKGIDLENRRVSLSMKDVEGDPWVDVLERYKEGQVVGGRLERKEDYGYFVSLEPGVTGLIPRATIERSPYGAEMEKAKKGDLVSVLIVEINQAEKRITLEPRSSSEEADWQSFEDQKASFGSLGAKLLEALRGKEQGK